MPFKAARRTLVEKKWLLNCAAICAAVVVAGISRAQTMGLLSNESGSFDGYTLFSSLEYPEVFLVDNQGRRVNSWPTTFVSGNTNYLLKNGHLIRAVDPDGNATFVAGGDGGMVQELDWAGRVRWEFLYSNDDHRHHHDIAVLPNGNVLILAWEYRSEEQAIAAGRDPATIRSKELWPEHIVEVKPQGPRNGKIVWEWHVWDHLVQDYDPNQENFGVVADHPELIDINFRRSNFADWMHANAVDYNAELDQILIGVPHFNEFWIIDHSTTAEEASGHTGGARGQGGDILYRWGNPQAYRRGTEADRRLYNQHDPHWIPAGLLGAGNILVFNNGEERPEGSFSTVDEIVTTADAAGDYPPLGPGQIHGPERPAWSFTATPPAALFSIGLGSAQRLPNGNTLICSGRMGRFFEIDASGAIVWLYVNPVATSGPMTQGEPARNLTFRAVRYGKDYLGPAKKHLAPGDPIELPLCGNDFVDGTDECDGSADTQCPGLCSVDCRCPNADPLP